MGFFRNLFNKGIDDDTLRTMQIFVLTRGDRNLFYEGEDRGEINSWLLKKMDDFIDNKATTNMHAINDIMLYIKEHKEFYEWKKAYASMIMINFFNLANKETTIESEYQSPEDLEIMKEVLEKTKLIKQNEYS